MTRVSLINSRFPESGVRAVESAMDKHGFYNPYLRKAVLSVIAKESSFKPKGEYSYSGTSNSRLRKLFGSRISDLSESELSSLKQNDVAFYEKIYGGRYGNADYGDGFKYRGRGMNQITFKSSYDKYGRLIGMDLVGYPDRLNDPRVAAEAAVVFLKERLKKIPSEDRFPVRDMNAFQDQETATYTVVSANAGWGKDVRYSHPETLERARKYSEVFQYPMELYRKFEKYGVEGIADSFKKSPTKFLKRNWMPISLGIIAVTATVVLIVRNRKN